MTGKIAGPQGTGQGPSAARRTVLLTGASGVVGSALLRRLRGFDVVCLVHRSPVSGPDVTTMPGDIAKPMLGLAGQAHARLAAKVDAVIHCAAVTDFNRSDGSLEATNVAGTEHVAAFAAAAEAVLYYVSTAFVHTTVDGDRGRTAIGYAASKLAAERVVRSSGVVPAEYGGKGACLLDAVRIQRAVGSRSPSLAVATTMHRFSVACLVELTAVGPRFEWVMLTAIAENSWLLSSGFAEGKPAQHILAPAMRGVPADGGLMVSGTKKPCSLTWSMNLMSASVAVTDPATGTDRLAVVLIPAESPGLERAPFWQTTALAAAESDQVTLTEVFVPDALIFYPHDGESMDPVQARGFTWFELLISASYLGAATNLAERAITCGRGCDDDRAGLAIELESAAAALEQAAASAATAGDNDALLARALYARFATGRAIERSAMSAAATLGGMAFISSPEIAYLLGATRV